MELLSVIVPVYNVERYLHQCVDSILKQTYPNLEIILVDDGSTDTSGKICDEYTRKDPRVHVIHKPNGGLSDARNAGIKAATGGYFGFVDSDDWIEEDMFESLYSACREYDADIAVCGFYREFMDRSIVSNKLENGVLSGKEALMQLISGETIQDHAWTKLYKAELWDGIEYPYGKSYEDIRTTYKTFTRARNICTVPAPLYHYRQRSGSITKSGIDDRKLGWLEAIEEQKAYFSGQIEGNQRLAESFAIKTLYSKGCILREWLLSSSEAAEEHIRQAASLYADIRKERRTIIRSGRCPRSIKLIAGFSFLPLSFLKAVMGSKLIRRYASNRGTPYQ